MSDKKTRKSKGSREDVVIRISKGNHTRLKRLVTVVEGKRGARAESTNELLNRLLDAIEALQTGETVYLVGDDAYSEVEVARGEAVVLAARFKDTPIKWPKIAVVIGEASP